jgi:hypothetical protein
MLEIGDDNQHRNFRQYAGDPRVKTKQPGIFCKWRRNKTIYQIPPEAIPVFQRRCSVLSLSTKTYKHEASFLVHFEVSIPVDY